MFDAEAFVASSDAGSYSAFVAYPGCGPFSCLNAPRDMPIGEAVSWASARAGRVRLRVGDRFFSAGARHIEGLPEWGPRDTPAPAPASPPQAWIVEAHTGWFRGDETLLSRRLAAVLGRDARVLEARATPNARQLAVTLRLCGLDDIEAHDVASALLRGAWKLMNITAVAPRDYDVSTVRLTGTPPA